MKKMINAALRFLKMYRKARREITPKKLEEMDFNSIIKKFEAEQPIIFSVCMLAMVLVYHFFFNKPTDAKTVENNK